jgi:hypothetical protein
MQMPHHMHPHHLVPPHPYAMYDPNQAGSAPVPQYYYAPQQHIMGPGQPPPMMQTYLPGHQPAYFPVIDPNIDSSPSNSSTLFSERANEH